MPRSRPTRRSIGASYAAEKAAVGRDLAAAKVAEIKGDPPKKKGGKLKKLLLVTGLAAIGGVIFKKVRGGSTSDNWQSSYVPTPAPTPPAAKDEDPGGSSPDEAIADAAEQPHPVSTPDDPAETVTIDEDAANKN